MSEDYVIMDSSDFDPTEAAMLEAAAKEAERGYTDAQLARAKPRPVGRPFSVGSSRASNVIKVRLDDVRNERINAYMTDRHISRSEAIRNLIDKGLATLPDRD